jgi:predicted DNA-binding transcriptional regulator AlpA
MSADVLYIADMAKLYGRTECAIRSAHSRGAGWLPAPFKLGRRLAWRSADVKADLARRAKKKRAG